MKHEYITWFDRARRKIDNVSLFFAEFCEMLNENGYAILRANAGHRALHPQVGAVSMRWSLEKDVIQLPANAEVVTEKILRHKNGAVRNTAFGHSTYASAGFQVSPMQRVIFERKPVREKIKSNTAAYPYPIIKDLAELGGTDYYAAPLFFTGGQFGFLSLATNKKGGYSASQIKLLETEIFPLFASVLEHYLRNEMLASLLRLYLGNVTGNQVLEGKIKRGQMDAIESVIWFSDIRGFTAMSTITPRGEMVEMLNAYYEAVISTISRFGGEVLKFLGDGLLVIFKADAGKELQTRYKALIAARAVNIALENFNSTRIEAGKIPIHHGIGLHYGTVEYGNIGSDTRLDFTAIGPAVNLASRIAAQCSALDQPVLVSAALARSLKVKFKSLGRVELKGLPEPEEILTLERSQRLRTRKT